MKITDQRVKKGDSGYFYYIGNQRYILTERVCKECSDVFLCKPYKHRGKEQMFCSFSCKAKQPCPNRRAEKHWNWNGGQYKMTSGYIYCLVDNEYRPQHHLVMQEKIGRKLTKHETVHHKNGVRDDNRIENLELWSDRHPKGQRIEDKVKWAKEILLEYGELTP